mmetsp:Transcript_970/g.3407  ORF Transcript_970/g.3407 Transcript_970/m.3407 type:complete len:150 (+) Transcript_970:45-494(+)
MGHVKAERSHRENGSHYQRALILIGRKDPAHELRVGRQVRRQGMLVVSCVVPPLALAASEVAPCRPPGPRTSRARLGLLVVSYVAPLLALAASEVCPHARAHEECGTPGRTRCSGWAERPRLDDLLADRCSHETSGFLARSSTSEFHLE